MRRSYTWGFAGSSSYLVAAGGAAERKRAKALRLPPPWSAHKTLGDRTLWRDREGIAARMAEALVREQRERFPAEPGRLAR